MNVRYDYRCNKCRRETSIENPHADEFPVYEMTCGWCDNPKIELIGYSTGDRDAVADLLDEVNDLHKRFETLKDKVGDDDDEYEFIRLH